MNISNHLKKILLILINIVSVSYYKFVINAGTDFVQ